MKIENAHPLTTWDHPIRCICVWTSCESYVYLTRGAPALGFDDPLTEPIMASPHWQILVISRSSSLDHTEEMRPSKGVTFPRSHIKRQMGWGFPTSSPVPSAPHYPLPHPLSLPPPSWLTPQSAPPHKVPLMRPRPILRGRWMDAIWVTPQDNLGFFSKIMNSRRGRAMI